MVYRRCNNCGKRYYKSPYDKSKYRFYCGLCGVQRCQLDIKSKEKRLKKIKKQWLNFKTMVLFPEMLLLQ